MHIHIVAGGPMDLLPDLRTFDREDVWWIGVDKGVHYLLERNLLPKRAFGDFDSVTKEELDKMRLALPDIEIYPNEKNETDTELAVNWALQQNPATIKMFGVSGGRLDHLFGNIQLLIKGLQAGIQIEIHDIQNKLYVVKEGSYQVSKSKTMPYISFLPITSTVTGITLVGFKYPLKNWNIHWGETLGISNELDCENGTFSFTNGILMVIRSRDIHPLF